MAKSPMYHSAPLKMKLSHLGHAVMRVVKATAEQLSLATYDSSCSWGIPKNLLDAVSSWNLSRKPTRLWIVAQWAYPTNFILLNFTPI